MNQQLQFIPCAHVQQGARSVKVLDLGDMGETVRAVELCMMCQARIKEDVLSEVVGKAIREAVREGRFTLDRGESPDGS